MKKSSIVIGILILLLIISIIFSIQRHPFIKIRTSIYQTKKYTSKGENAKCLKCHSLYKYEINSPMDSTIILKKRMPTSCVIDTNLYYTSNHWDFKCIDCHSDEYTKVPHDSKLKYAQISTCLDCHADDEKYVKYHFENIDTAFHKSVHYKNDSMNFNCWSCHNPHYNKTNMRDSLQDILVTIAYDNAMCLKCHDTGSAENYFIFYSNGKPNVNIYEKHKWLPSLENHLINVRCLDCHATTDNKTLVEHNIQPKSLSIRDCADCHTPNSKFLKMLYKNRIKKKGSFGFLDASTLEEQVIIGMNRNHYLILFSFLFFGLSCFAILVHIIFRIIKRK